MPGYKIVLTGDRTVMSTYGSGLFYGFLTTGPTKGFIPLPILTRTILRPVPVGKRGEAILAPHGLRRVEAALRESKVVDEDDIIVVPPRNLYKAVSEKTKIIGIYTIDPLGRGPASTTFSGFTGIVHSEPITAYYFRKLITSKIVQEARRRGTRVVVGGPGTWQFDLESMKRLGIDIVVHGECDKAAPKLFQEILEDSIKIPTIINIPILEYPRADEIPLLKGATIGGYVEVSRGCGRGCKFCRPTMVPLRHRPIEQIVKDVEINVRYGQTGICLGAEDIFKYGARPLEVRHEKVIKLFKSILKVPGVMITSFAHANLSSIAAYPNTVREVVELLGVDEYHWIGFQTGIETGSPHLIELHMDRKPYPFKASEWPEVVEMAFSICHDLGLVPAATIIVNLPGERESDVVRTVELIEDLKFYRSLIVPLLYVDFTKYGSMRFVEDAKWYHWELYKVIWRHDMKWLPELVKGYTRRNSVITRIFMDLFIRMLRIVNRKVEAYIEDNLRKLRERDIRKITPIVHEY
ncbi:MAG: hypothetical protein DRJ49_03440 [Thermoprotei archaeon]|nr:MAG: hypothetical protein DRJ49_03440 [Thermoprotei archaeon]